MIFKQKTRDGNSVLKSIFLAHFILVCHIFLIAGMGLLVLFFQGIINYMFWIFLGGSTAIVASGYMFYKRMKAEGKSLWEAMKPPLLSGRAVEVSLLRGVASVKIGGSNRPRSLECSAGDLPRLEDPVTIRIRELSELAHLLENDRITAEEYQEIKRQLIKTASQA